MSSISSIGGGISQIGVFGGFDPLPTASFGGSDPVSTPTFGGSDPAATPSFGGSDPVATPSFGGSDPAPTPNFGGSDPVPTTNTAPTFGGSDPAGTAATSTPSVRHYHQQSGGISSKIETAVTSALQKAPQGTDPKQTIQNAVADVLKSSSGKSTTHSTGNNDATSTDVSASNFAQLLQQHNINPKQFRKNLQTALQGIQQGGGLNFGALFKDFPRGTSVDATA